MEYIKVYFRVHGFAFDENNQSVPVGMTLDLGKASKDISYEELTKDLDIQVLLKMLNVDDVFSAENVEIISPEQYEFEFGGSEDEQS